MTDLPERYVLIYQNTVAPSVINVWVSWVDYMGNYVKEPAMAHCALTPLFPGDDFPEVFLAVNDYRQLNAALIKLTHDEDK
jgi:hypothetical protein